MEVTLLVKVSHTHDGITYVSNRCETIRKTWYYGMTNSDIFPIIKYPTETVIKLN